MNNPFKEPLVAFQVEGVPGFHIGYANSDAIINSIPTWEQAEFLAWAANQHPAHLEPGFYPVRYTGSDKAVPCVGHWTGSAWHTPGTELVYDRNEYTVLGPRIELPA
jgi:hypothetical protein